MNVDGIIAALVLLVMFFVIPAMLNTPTRSKTANKTAVDATGITNKHEQTAMTFTAINAQ